MTQTGTKIDMTPILTVLGNKPLPVGDPDFTDGWIRGQEWFYRHLWDCPIDSQYVKNCVKNWYARGIVSEQWRDVLYFHMGYVLAMVDAANSEQ